MPLKKDESGKRSISVEVEVPGSPEEVWAAIATGPGVTSWFMPTTVEERTGGAINCNFGPGMEAISTITEWSPPHRLAAESTNLGPGAPAMATEWTVEARSGDTCVVRVVHSLFTGEDDWDEYLEDIESGWPHFFNVLRMYLGRFRDRQANGISAQGVTEATEEEAWESITRALGIEGAKEGERTGERAPGAPPLSGVVEYVGDRNKIYLWLEDPAAGIGALSVYSYKEKVHVVVSMYLFSDDAAQIVARDEPRWRAWLAELFRAPTPAEIH